MILYRGYYGDAGSYIEKYIELMHQQLIKSNQKLDIFDDPVDAKHTYLSKKNMKKYNQLFDQAEAAVAKNPKLLDRVKIARVPLMYARLEIARTEFDSPRSLYKKNKKDQYLTKNEFKGLLNKFIKLCKKQGVTRLME